MAVDDFRWLGDDDSPLGRNFCLSFVRGAAPAEVTERLGGTQTVNIVGASRLHEAAGLVQLRPDVYEDGVFHTDRVTGLVLVAAANVGEWTMIVEPNGYLCTDRAVMGVLSRSGEQLTFYFNENTSPSFTPGGLPDPLITVLRSNTHINRQQCRRSPEPLSQVI
ncbi:DUF6461 domain-containing protein [Actinoplanes sp. NPDC089786]|uniref:DUF6461 domain-containing protein n=1 Tax=Actinoplanes sp. NPDC089786 TaxID=3155185 RepID=UPI00342E86A9